jgi:hypothetical protein
MKTCLRIERLESRDVPNAGAVRSAHFAAGYGQLPLSFETNQGQTDPAVRFLSRGPGYTVFLMPTEMVLSLQHEADPEAIEAPSESQTGTVERMQLAGSNPAAQAVPEAEMEGKCNYFIGNDPIHWYTDIPTYRTIEYQDVYPGIDLLYYGSQQQLEYDFAVRPGGDPSAIQLALPDAKSLTINSTGDLVIHGDGGEIIEHAPVAYQESEAGRDAVAACYVLEDNGRVSLEVGAFDPTRPLIIDPVLSYSTYLGGSNTDLGYGIAVDSAGEAFITGQTASIDFPLRNPFQGTNHGNAETFVAKLNANGTALVYSTYLGGSGFDSGRGIAVDADGNAYVTGLTTSNNFPIINPVQPTNHGRQNAFVTELNAGGTALLYSTYLGGRSDDAGLGIAVDPAGDAYITGSTDSADFPTLNPLQAANRGGTDAFVTKLNSTGRAIVYSTYLGGRGEDAGNTIAVDAVGNAYVTGTTASGDFPTQNPFQAANHGSTNAFLAKINSGGTALVYSTYLGGSGNDYAQGIAVDAAGEVFVTGTTSSANFPTVNPVQATNRGNANAFIAKFNTGGTALLYSTFLGGSRADNGSGIAVDTAGDAYVVGSTVSSDFPTVHAVQATYGGGFKDAFVIKINAEGTAIVYSTYLGGGGEDYGQAIAVDAAGNAYATGFTSSVNFPTVNPLQATNGGGYDAFVAKLSSGPASTFVFNYVSGLPAVGYPITFTITAQDSAGDTVTSYRGRVHFTSSDMQATLPMDYSFTAADAGVHTFVVTARTAGNQTLTVVDTANSNLTATVSGVISGPASSLLVFGTDTQAGMAAPVYVLAVDANGNLALGYTGSVHFTSSDGQAILPVDYTFTNDDAGIHIFTATLKTAGSQTITATDTAMPSITGTGMAGVSPAPAASFVLLAPDTVTAGTSFDVTVIALDAYLNLAVDYTGTVRFTSSDSQAALPADYTFTAADTGFHTFRATLNSTGPETITAVDRLSASINGTAVVNVTAPGSAAQDWLAAVSGFSIELPFDSIANCRYCWSAADEADLLRPLTIGLTYWDTASARSSRR